MGKKRMKRKGGRLSQGLTPGRKVSEMVLEYASDYIAMGEDLEQRQNYLNAACSAWNIANLPAEKRSDALQRYLDEFRKYNSDGQELENLKKDLEQLIDIKLRMFPEVKKEIVGAELVEVDGKEHLNIASVPHGS